MADSKEVLTPGSALSKELRQRSIANRLAAIQCLVEDTPAIQAVTMAAAPRPLQAIDLDNLHFTDAEAHSRVKSPMDWGPGR